MSLLLYCMYYLYVEFPALASEAQLLVPLIGEMIVEPSGSERPSYPQGGAGKRWPGSAPSAPALRP